MTAFDVIGHNEEATPYKHILVSLKEQSHALRFTHNTKTWNLSAVTYALHLNDCMVLFEDLKRRWKSALPYKEAWDVDLNKWKNQVWNDANNANNNDVSGWQSLCDKDYAKFIELSEKLVGGKIPLAPLLDFVEGKQSNLSRIIIDMARELSQKIGEIDSMLNESNRKAYEHFYDGLMNDFQSRHKSIYHVIFKGGEPVSFDKWAASKSSKKLPEAIEKEIKRLVEGLVGKNGDENAEEEGERPWCEMWDSSPKEVQKRASKEMPWCELMEECYDEKLHTIGHEEVGRYIFHDRKNIIARRMILERCTIENDISEMDNLLYTISMIEFLNEKLKSGVSSKNSLAESGIPEYFRDATMMKAWNGLKEVGYLDGQYQLTNNASLSVAKQIIEYFCEKKAERTGNRNCRIEWSPFEKFWGKKNLKAEKKPCPKTDNEKLSKIFSNL